MLKPVEEASYEEVVENTLLALNTKKKRWFIGRTLRFPFSRTSSFYCFVSVSNLDTNLIQQFKHKHDAINKLKDCDHTKLYITDDITEIKNFKKS